MRKLVMTVVGVTVLCGMTALAQPEQAPAKPPMAPHEFIMEAHWEAEVLHLALMESKHDPATLKLLHAALQDRTTLLKAELERVEKAKDLVIEMQKPNEDAAAIRQARAAVRAAQQTVVADAKAFSAACKAIRQHINTLPGGGHEPPKGIETPAKE